MMIIYGWTMSNSLWVLHTLPFLSPSFCHMCLDQPVSVFLCGLTLCGKWNYEMFGPVWLLSTCCFGHFRGPLTCAVTKRRLTCQRGNSDVPFFVFNSSTVLKFMSEWRTETSALRCKTNLICLYSWRSCTCTSCSNTVIGRDTVSSCCHLSYLEGYQTPISGWSPTMARIHPHSPHTNRVRHVLRAQLLYHLLTTQLKHFCHTFVELFCRIQLYSGGWTLNASWENRPI